MPRIRRRGVPKALLEHFVAASGRTRDIGPAAGTLCHLAGDGPEVPHDRWFKRFPQMIVCSDGELGTTFLRLGQVADGEDVI